MLARSFISKQGTWSELGIAKPQIFPVQVILSRGTIFRCLQGADILPSPSWKNLDLILQNHVQMQSWNASKTKGELLDLFVDSTIAVDTTAALAYLFSNVADYKWLFLNQEQSHFSHSLK